MGQIANGRAKEEMSYRLKVQSRYNGSDCERHGKGRKGILPEGAKREVQSGYDGSDCKRHGKGRNDILSEGAERVRWVRSRMA